MNLFGALRTSMATCGYESVKEFQKAEIMVAPALLTEGKSCSGPAWDRHGATDGEASMSAVRRRCGAPRQRERRPTCGAATIGATADPARTVGPGRRLRRAIRPADRQAGTRGARLLRDRPAHDHRRRDRGSAARRGDLQRAARRRCMSTGHLRSILRSTTSVSPCSASVTAHSSWPATSVAKSQRRAEANTGGPDAHHRGRRAVRCRDAPPTSRCG